MVLFCFVLFSSLFFLLLLVGGFVGGCYGWDEASQVGDGQHHISLVSP